MLRRYQRQLLERGWVLETWDHGLHYVWRGWRYGLQWVAYLGPATRHPGPEETWSVQDWYLVVRPDLDGLHEDVEPPGEYLVLRTVLTTPAESLVGGIVYRFFER